MTNETGSVRRAIEILGDLVAFETVSSQSNLRLVDYVDRLLETRGIATERVPNADGTKASLFAAIGPLRPEGVILSGHTDVVPVVEQPWSSDPFVLTRRADRLFGRGTADMKTFLACCLAALDTVELDRLERPIYLAFSYDEEIGCLGAPALIEHLARRIAWPACVIVGEPSSMRIIDSHKSVHLLQVRVTGVAAHSSTPHLGVSANHIAIRLMATLVRIAADLEAGSRSDARFDPPYSTLTIGRMEGGTALNILASEAMFAFDLRCLPQDLPEDVLRDLFVEVEAVRRTHPQATITVETQAAVPALAPAPLDPAERLVRAVGGDNRPSLAASYGAEAGQYQGAGLATVICGPGSMDQGHQPDEFVEVAQIARCMDFLERLLTTLSQPPLAA